MDSDSEFQSQSQDNASDFNSQIQSTIYIPESPSSSFLGPSISNLGLNLNSNINIESDSEEISLKTNLSWDKSKRNIYIFSERLFTAKELPLKQNEEPKVLIQCTRYLLYFLFLFLLFFL